jgi:hypothetical protein
LGQWVLYRQEEYDKIGVAFLPFWLYLLHCRHYIDVMGRDNEEYLITGGMECKPGRISKVVSEALDQLIEMYEEGAITKSTLVIMIDEFYIERYKMTLIGYAKSNIQRM